MVAVRRIVFFVISTIIIALLVWWGFDEFELFTKIYAPSELIDPRTGNTIGETKGSYKIGLDLVLISSIGLSALGIVIINFFKIYFATKKENQL